MIPLLIRCLLFTLKCPCKLAACYFVCYPSSGVHSVISSPGRNNEISVLLSFEGKDGKAEGQRYRRGVKTKRDSERRGEKERER